MIKEILAIAENAYKFESVQQPFFQVEGGLVVCRSPAQHNAKRAKVLGKRISALLSAADLEAAVSIQEDSLNNSRQHSIQISYLGS